MSGILELKPWSLEKIVLPQHTDHAGVMWHGSYVRLLEEARINALLNVGLAYEELSRKGYELPVIELQIKYKIPLFHGDRVSLKSWVTPGKGPRWRWRTNFYKGHNYLSAIANVDLVLIKKDFSEKRLLRNGPVYIQKALLDLQKGPT